MKGQIIRVLTEDNVELQGIVYSPKSQDAIGVLHVHGSYGNFYENQFLDALADYYSQRNLMFVSGNNRGHDGMTAYERFEVCTLDIKAWLKWMQSKGLNYYILQGHSFGAHKVIHYLVTQKDPNIIGCILLAPFDLLAFYKVGSSDVREKNLTAVRKLAESDADSLVPKRIYDFWPISAGTYLNLLGPTTETDIFPFRKSNLDDSSIKRIRLPIFAAIGSDDFSSLLSPSECVEQLSALNKQHIRIESHLIKDAPHNFFGCIDDLVKKIGVWLDRRIVSQLAN